MPCCCEGCTGDNLEPGRTSVFITEDCDQLEALARTPIDMLRERNRVHPRVMSKPYDQVRVAQVSHLLGAHCHPWAGPHDTAPSAACRSLNMFGAGLYLSLRACRPTNHLLICQLLLPCRPATSLAGGLPVSLPVGSLSPNLSGYGSPSIAPSQRACLLCIPLPGHSCIRRQSAPHCLRLRLCDRPTASGSTFLSFSSCVLLSETSLRLAALPPSAHPSG